MASSVPVKTVLVVALAIAVVGGAVTFGGVVALDLQQDADQQDGNQQDDGLPVDDDSDRQQTALLRVVHASPDAPAVNVTIDDETILSGVEFGTVSGYLSFEAGTYDVTIRAAASDAILFDDAVTFDPRSVTTIAASGEVGEDAETAFESIAFADDGGTPAENESALRIVHLSPDAPAVDVTAENGSVVLAENVSFRNASNYVTVPAGNYTAEIRPATATNDGSILTTVDVSLDGETAYTAFAVGYLTPDDSPADTPFEIVLTEDASRTVALPSDGTAEDEAEGDGEGETDDDTEGDAADDTDDDDGADADADDESAADGGDDDSSDGADGSDDDAEPDGDGESEGDGDSNEDDDSDGDGESDDDSESDGESTDGNEADDGNDTGADDGGDEADGDDGTDAASQSGPETVEECRVIDEPGTYEVTQTLGSTNVQSIDVGNGIVRETCLAIQSSDVVLEGGGFLVSGSGVDLSVGVHVYDPAGSSVQNVTVRNLQVEGWSNGVQVGVDTWAVASGAPARASIENVQSIGNGHHGFFVVSGGTELTSVVANDNGASGIGVFDSGGLQVTGATTTGNAEHGVALLEEVFESTVTDVTTTNNGGAELYVGELSSGNAFTDITFGAADDSVEGFEGSDNTIDDPPEDAEETDETTDEETSGQNGTDDENETESGTAADEENGTDTGSETGDDNESTNGSETDIDDGSDDGNSTEAGTEGDGDTEAENGSETSEADGTVNGSETDIDDGTGDENGTEAGTVGEENGTVEGEENGTVEDDGNGTDDGSETSTAGSRAPITGPAARFAWPAPHTASTSVAVARSQP